MEINATNSYFKLFVGYAGLLITCESSAAFTFSHPPGHSCLCSATCFMPAQTQMSFIEQKSTFKFILKLKFFNQRTYKAVFLLQICNRVNRSLYLQQFKSDCLGQALEQF